MKKHPSANPPLWTSPPPVCFIPAVDLTSDNLRDLQYAEGYLELGMLDDAWTTLDQIEPAHQTSPPLVLLRMKILMKGKKWEQAVSLGETLCRALPDDPMPFIETAFCLHEFKRTQEAKETLLRSPASLREDALFHYNLGCYEAQLGNLQEAFKLVQKAIQMAQGFQEMAIKDTDLEPIREMLTNT